MEPITLTLAADDNGTPDRAFAGRHLGPGTYLVRAVEGGKDRTAWTTSAPPRWRTTFRIWSPVLKPARADGILVDGNGAFDTRQEALLAANPEEFTLWHNGYVFFFISDNPGSNSGGITLKLEKLS